MLFTFDINVLTTNTEANKVEQPLLLAHGIITFVSVLFPPGCHGLVHCAIFHHEHQIFPSREDEDLVGDGFPIEWGEYYEMYQPPHDLKARLWEVGCSYDHTVTIRIAVLPRRAIIALAVVDAIKSVFGMLSPKRIFTREREVNYYGR